MQMVFEAKNDKFTAEGLRCRQDLKYENFTWSFGRLHIPNRTFLVRFGGISGESGWAKIPMVRPNEPDMPPNRTKKVLLGIYRTQIHPKI